MKLIEHRLGGASLGTTRHVTSIHFGTPRDGRPKAYIQAGLHASELPGLLVAHHLRERLRQEEEAGRILGEVVLVPISNPIGLDQTLLTYQMGRFDLASGENFNRHFPLLSTMVAEQIDGRLTGDGERNARLARAALIETVKALPDTRPVDSLRKTLMYLSCDADVVLDLHCDCESVLHLYVDPATADDAFRLSALMGADVTLYADVQGNAPFDEITGRFWRDLKRQVSTYPLTIPTIIATVELRGQLDVSHEMASRDAANILRYLRVKGVLAGGEGVVIPDANHRATPLDGTEVLYATGPGVIAYLAACGQRMKKGDPVVEVIDPVTGHASRYHAGIDGVFFARQNRRYATSGMDLAYIAGSASRRVGSLLSA